MSGRPPARSGSGDDWEREPPAGGNPNQTIGGSYRGGPMAPGPRPGATIGGRGLDLSRDPGRSSATNSHPNPNATLARSDVRGTARSRAISAVMKSVAPQEQIWTGNLGRLWVSEIASTAGDVIIGSGLVIWFMQLTYNFTAVAWLLIALAAPAALVSLFAGGLGSMRHPNRLLGVLAVLRVALAVTLVFLHFHTILLLLYALAAGLSLSASLRAAVRRGAVARGVPVRARGVLASGDQIAAGALAVAGPAVATLLYILDGERIFTIAIGGALCYAAGLFGESRSETLPDKILYQRPVGEASVVQSVWQDEEDGQADAEVIAAEHAAPVWELSAPPNVRAAFKDLDAGLQIAGSYSHTRTAFVALGLLACVGGVLAVLEPFYVWTMLRQPPYALGLLFTATGLGAALGSALVVEARAGSRIFLILGLLGSGAGLVLLPRMQDLPHALGVIALLGASNVLALRGGQIVLLRHFVPVAQRAVAAAQDAARALLALAGMATAVLLGKGHKLPLPTLGLPDLLILGGLALILAAVIVGFLLILPNRASAATEDDSPAAPDDDLPDDDDPQDSRLYSRYGPAPRRDAYGGYTNYSAAYPAYSAEYETPRRRYDDEDDGDAPPPRRRR